MSVEKSCLAAKLGSFAELSELELETLADLHAVPIHIQSGRELLHQGVKGDVAYVLDAGWGCSFKTLQDGGRQIITFPIPGDYVGLRSVLLRTSDHAFSAVTDVIVRPIEITRLLNVFNEFPHLGAAILWSTSRDEAITVEHLASVGRRTAIERASHFFLELSDRLRLVGLANLTEFVCPLNQYHLADALGLSAIHVNRVLRELRETNLLTFKDRLVIIHDRAALVAMAGYEEMDDGTTLLKKDRRPTR